MDGSTSLCQVSTGQEDDWKLLYELAFPADERTAVADLRTLISNGTLLLHKTVNKQNELLCFSLVNLMSNFAFLAYIATDTTKRSTGVGSKHMKQLIQILKTQYPNYTALFLEIESTKKEGLDADTQKMRTRRLAFYQRLGAKRLSKKYGMPSYAKKGTKAAGELLWIELTDNCVCDSSLVTVIQEIFLKGYGLPSTDAQVTGITDQWNNPESVCAVSEDSVIPAKETTAVDSDKTTPASDSVVETTAPEKDAVVEATDLAKDKVTENAAPVTAPATEPVVDTTAPTTDKVVEVAALATEKVAEVATPSTEKVVEVADPATEEVVETTAPATEEVVETTAPATEEVVETTAPATEEVVETTAPATEEVVEKTARATDADATVAPAADNHGGKAESNPVVKFSDADAPVQTSAPEDAPLKPTSEVAPLVPTKDENEPPQS